MFSHDWNDLLNATDNQDIETMRKILNRFGSLPTKEIALLFGSARYHDNNELIHIISQFVTVRDLNFPPSEYIDKAIQYARMRDRMSKVQPFGRYF